MTRAVTNEMIANVLGVKTPTWFNFLKIAGSAPPIIGKVFSPETSSCSRGYSVPGTIEWLKQRTAITDAQCGRLTRLAKPIVVT